MNNSVGCMVEFMTGVDETDSKLAFTAIEREDPGGGKNTMRVHRKH